MIRWLSLLLICVAGVSIQPATAAPKAGASFRDCKDICPEMIVVPDGLLLIGSPDNEIGRDAWEGPQRDITIHAIAVGRYDVTRAQWAAFAAATGRPTASGCAWAGASGPVLDPDKSWRKVDFAQDDTHPVVCVSWNDAQDYVRWLSARTGKPYRLLSEAEWEYAARAGTSTPYWWGSDIDHSRANYGADTCCSGLAEGKDVWVATSPIDAFPANPFGLFDMNGNVLQWVQDCLSSYADKPADGTAYESPELLKADGPYSPKMAGLKACDFRMARGGDWGDPPRMLRSAFRNYGPPKGATLETYRSGGVGFRVARGLK
jgi:formylglycine-generating enzyme required for sulfatase activity